MDRNIGLWIDHKQAFLIWQGRKKVEVIPSNLEPRTHFSGGTHIGGRYNQNLDSELKHEDRYKNQLGKYYEHVIATIRNADSIFIMGPGEAKIELEKAIKKHKDMIKKLLRVETADKMTKNQMAARVREFFAKNKK
jgi:stalled ribosome rescue protein Dom34